MCLLFLQSGHHFNVLVVILGGFIIDIPHVCVILYSETFVGRYDNSVLLAVQL